jgi:hypothetical protein
MMEFNADNLKNKKLLYKWGMAMMSQHLTGNLRNRTHKCQFHFNENQKELFDFLMASTNGVLKAPFIEVSFGEPFYWVLDTEKVEGHWNPTKTYSVVCFMHFQLPDELKPTTSIDGVLSLPVGE